MFILKNQEITAIASGSQSVGLGLAHVVWREREKFKVMHVEEDDVIHIARDDNPHIPAENQPWITFNATTISQNFRPI